MADASEVGKYGTIRVLKRKDPSSCIAAYPLDEDECTFGRNTDCSIRLYYPEVSSLHCKIIFEDRKVRNPIHSGQTVAKLSIGFPPSLWRVWRNCRWVPGVSRKHFQWRTDHRPPR